MGQKDTFLMRKMVKFVQKCKENYKIKNKRGGGVKNIECLFKYTFFIYFDAFPYELYK